MATTAISMYASASDSSTVACDLSLVSRSLETLSQLSSGFSSNRPVGSFQEAVEIATQELSPQGHAPFMLEIVDIFGDNTDDANSLVALQSHLVERNVDWM